MKTFRKVLSLLLATAMLVGMTPVTFADSDSASADVTVSIAVAGEVEVAAKTLTVTDQNGSGGVDIDDVLYAAHEAYYEGGAEAGYATANNEWGLSIAELWGDNSGFFSYYLNNASANSLSDAVSDGDYVYAFVYEDQTGWSDSYSCFNKYTASIATDETLELTLSDVGWNPTASPLADATITVDGTETTYTTDEEGKVSLSFDAAGKYTVSAVKEGKTLVPPVCVVTVGEPEPEPATVTVDFTAQAAGGFLCAPQFSAEVSGDLSDKYGFT
ncbi:MAG: hypothetical protein K5767_00855, partial [Clostridia bacterium]|nr:hypothetical protein [Clostridia bacterium]